VHIFTDVKGKREKKTIFTNEDDGLLGYYAV
jgi:hypothetical protein